MRFPLTLLMLALLPVSAFGQDLPPLMVEQAVQEALVANARLKAATHRVTVAREGERAARPLSNPSLTFSPALTSLSGTTEEILFVQPLEINGVRTARTAQARAEREVAEQEAISEARSTVYAVKVAYFELARAREQLRLSRDLLKTAEEFDRIARRQVELGSRAGVDTVQTSLEVARAKQQVTLSEAEVTSAEATMNALRNVSPETPIASLPTLTYLSEPVDRTGITAHALQNRSEIKAQQARQETVRSVTAGIRAEGWPDIAPLIRVGSLTRPQKNDTGNGFGVGVAISLPLLDYGSRRARLRQSDATLQVVEAEQEALRRSVEQEVTQALARLKAAETIIATYREGVLEAVTKLRDASRTGFQEGQTSVLAVLEAQRSYRTIQNEYLRALTDALIARAELERVTASFVLPTLEEKP